MNKKNETMHLGIGAPSLFMVFVVLVMCILAILAYLKANTYYEGTLHHLEMTSQYYESQSELLNIYENLDVHQIETQLKDHAIAYYHDQDMYILEKEMNDEMVLQLQFQVQSQKRKLISIKTINQEESYGSKKNLRGSSD